MLRQAHVLALGLSLVGCLADTDAIAVREFCAGRSYGWYCQTEDSKSELGSIYFFCPFDLSEGKRLECPAETVCRQTLENTVKCAVPSARTGTVSFAATAYNDTEKRYNGTLASQPTLLDVLRRLNATASQPPHLWLVAVTAPGSTTPVYIVSALAGCDMTPLDYCFYASTYINEVLQPDNVTYDKIAVRPGDSIRLDYATPMSTGTCGSACSPEKKTLGADRTVLV